MSAVFFLARQNLDPTYCDKSYQAGGMELEMKVVQWMPFTRSSSYFAVLGRTDVPARLFELSTILSADERLRCVIVSEMLQLHAQFCIRIRNYPILYISSERAHIRTQPRLPKAI